MSSYIYDKECLDRYGMKTCVLFESSKDIFDMRPLDYDNKSQTKLKIARAKLYEAIPKLLMNRYTVVIVEMVDTFHEVTAVHLPVQCALNTPPILQ